ncbi:hypothetical protein MNBD_ACTINO02-1553, partial [hydrothermal vent metagenome]
MAPDSPELPWTTTKQPTAPRTPLFAAATAFAAVLLIIGVTTLVLTQSGTGEAPITAQAPGATSQTTPPTTGVLSGDLTDSEAAMIWRDAVDRALDEAGWSNRVTFASSSITPLADGGNVVASIRNDAGELLLVVAFRGFRPGEYSTDPTWQRTLTGTDEPGDVTDDGTFFVPESSEFPWVMVITDKGALTIKVEGAALAYEPTDRKLMRTMAASLIPAISDITTLTDGVQANVSTTTIVSPIAGLAPLSALPMLGIDLPGWNLIRADESDTPEDGGARFSTYGLVDESSGYTVMTANLAVRGFQTGSIYEIEAIQKWVDSADYELVTIRGHEARMFITGGGYYVVWRESDDAHVTLSFIAPAQAINNPADQALALAAAVIDLTEDRWNSMLSLDERTVITSPPTT